MAKNRKDCIIRRETVRRDDLMYSSDVNNMSGPHRPHAMGRCGSFLGTRISCVKTAEPSEIHLGKTLAGPGNLVLDVGSRSPYGKGYF